MLGQDGLPSDTPWPQEPWQGCEGSIACEEPAGGCRVGAAASARCSSDILLRVFPPSLFSFWCAFLSCVGWTKRSENRKAQSCIARPPPGARGTSGQPQPAMFPHSCYKHQCSACRLLAGSSPAFLRGAVLGRNMPKGPGSCVGGGAAAECPW